MIIEYHRPKTIEEALQYLSREGVKTVPMGGGTILNQPSSIPLAVVDLQSLELDRIERRGKDLIIGATATLQSLLDAPDIAPSIKKVIEHEATYNLRQVATLAGIAHRSRWSLASHHCIVGLDVQITLLPGEEKISLGDLLPVRGERLPGRLVTRIDLPLNASLCLPLRSPDPCRPAHRLRGSRIMAFRTNPAGSRWVMALRRY